MPTHRTGWQKGRHGVLACRMKFAFWKEKKRRKEEEKNSNKYSTRTNARNLQLASEQRNGVLFIVSPQTQQCEFHPSIAQQDARWFPLPWLDSAPASGTFCLMWFDEPVPRRSQQIVLWQSCRAKAKELYVVAAVHLNLPL